MSKKGTGLQAPDDISARWASLLRTKYSGRHAAKRIERDFNVKQRTAKSWLSGEVSPRLANFKAAADIFGITAVLGVLFPDTEEFEKQKLRDDLAVLQTQLAAVSQKLGELSDAERSQEGHQKDLAQNLPPDRKGSD